LNGVLEGGEMARVFAWLRPNDLVWNYWVNNYLMGNPPPAFDILYWNNDTTRLPAKFHGQLIDILTERQFATPGALKVLGSAIDLSQVDLDKYLVAGVTDHITPWKGVYDTARMLGGRNDFILSSSGHIQSLINPPGNPKARFFLNSDLLAEPDKWLSAAQAKSGSWWEHWRQWLAEQSGDMRAAPDSLGPSRNAPGSKAPGTYVFEP
jgi:polyhydroxyalkanoate synthase